ncbi:MAG: MarR family transcriptional regulator, partial [Bauldia litoralis]
IFALRRAGAPYARRPTDLYRALLVTSGAITKQVDRLAKLGFVRRRPDRANGGGFQVELTDKGLDAADRAIKAVADSVFLRDGHNPLTARERATLIALCSKLLSNLEQPEDDAPED